MTDSAQNIPSTNSQTNLPTDSSPYFSNTEYSDPKKNGFLEWFKKFWHDFQYYARQVWPWVYRLINFIVYEIIKVVKGIVKMGLQQLGMFKD